MSGVATEPNYIPLNRTAVDQIGAAVAPFSYERVFGAFAHRNILRDGKAAVARSIERYLAAIRD